MEQPLGCAVGNWLEVAECVRTLRGDGPADLTELSVALAAQMLVQALGSTHPELSTRDKAAAAARAQLGNGKALAAFRKMVGAQGGDVGVVDQLAASPHGPEKARGANGGEVLVLTGVYGAGKAEPAAVGAVVDEAEGRHAPFWAPRSPPAAGGDVLEGIFDQTIGRGGGGGGGGSGKRSRESAVEMSAAGPHGAPVASIVGLNALQVGQACVAIGAGRQALGEALTMGSGVLLHKKMGAELRQGDTLFTLFAEVGGATQTAAGARRAISAADVEVACKRLFGAFEFGPPEAAPAAAARAGSLIRCFVERDGAVSRLA